MVVLQPKKKKLTNQQLGTGVGQKMLLEEIKEEKKIDRVRSPVELVQSVGPFL